MQCGHCYCLECLEKLIDRNKQTQRVSCSVCRYVQYLNDISYIKVKGTNDATDDIEIKGSYSTKIQAIVKHTLLLRQDDETVKILVFSSWPSVLTALSEAFHKNNISHEILQSQKLQQRLDNFKVKKFYRFDS